MLTKVLVIELAPQGIWVRCVVPGVITTEEVQTHIWNETNIAENDIKPTRIPSGHEGISSEVAIAALHFKSGESNTTTGFLGIVDGGYSLDISAYWQASVGPGLKIKKFQWMM